MRLAQPNLDLACRLSGDLRVLVLGWAGCGQAGRRLSVSAGAPGRWSAASARPDEPGGGGRANRVAAIARRGPEGRDQFGGAPGAYWPLIQWQVVLTT